MLMLMCWYDVVAAIAKAYTFCYDFRKGTWSKGILFINIIISADSLNVFAELGNILIMILAYLLITK